MYLFCVKIISTFAKTIYLLLKLPRSNTMDTQKEKKKPHVRSTTLKKNPFRPYMLCRMLKAKYNTST